MDDGPEPYIECPYCDALFDDGWRADEHISYDHNDESE